VKVSKLVFEDFESEPELVSILAKALLRAACSLRSTEITFLSRKFR
jgi:hypothetical protein